MLTWVIYDISDDNIRAHTADVCKKYGLYRVQKSCFLGEPTCDACAGNIELLGQGFDMELVRDQIGVMFL